MTSAFRAKAAAYSSFGVSEKVMKIFAENSSDASSGGAPMSFKAPGVATAQPPNASDRKLLMKNFLRQPLPSSQSTGNSSVASDGILTSSRAPESLGNFRIIKRIGGEAKKDQSTSEKPEIPSGKSGSKISRVSDGSGFKALEAAALGSIDDGSSQVSNTNNPVSSDDAARSSGQKLMSILKPPSGGELPPAPPSAAGEKSAVASAGSGISKKLLALIKPQVVDDSHAPASPTSANAVVQSEAGQAVDELLLRAIAPDVDSTLLIESESKSTPASDGEIVNPPKNVGKAAKLRPVSVLLKGSKPVRESSK